MCPRSERCVPRTWLCDGDFDCSPDSKPPSEDEAPDLCSRKCGRGEFQCLSGQCVPRHFYCDGDDDCADKVCCLPYITSSSLKIVQFIAWARFPVYVA